jgi:hypothetical protein
MNKNAAKATMSNRKISELPLEPLELLPGLGLLDTASRTVNTSAS